MKYSYMIVILFLTMTVSIKAQVYIQRPSGHKITFLIISKDSVVIESYKLHMKVSPRICIRKSIAAKINQYTNNTIHTDKFLIKEEANNIVRIVKTNYYKDIKIEHVGDFYFIDNLFGIRSNTERLNICRDYCNSNSRLVK